MATVYASPGQASALSLLELSLQPFPLSPAGESAGAVRRLQGRVGTPAATHVRMEWHLEGDLDQINVPAPTTVSRADELWRHTCFEAFLTGSAGTRYLEFNFAPSGEWAAYGFDGYRRGMTPLPMATPSARWERESAGLALRVDLPVDILRTELGNGPWRLGFAAVVEGLSGNLGFWALKHPGARPDFHHPDSHLLEIRSSTTEKSSAP